MKNSQTKNVLVQKLQVVMSSKDFIMCVLTNRKKKKKNLKITSKYKYL